MKQLLYSVGAVVLGISMLSDSIIEASRNRALNDHGVLADLEPITQVIVEQHKRSRTYYANLVFYDRSGKRVLLARQEVPDGIGAAGGGSGLQIRYLPESPKIHIFTRPAQPYPDSGPFGWLLLGGGLLSLAWMFFTRERKPARR